MRRFECREIREAEAYAAAGGQALHLHRIIVDPRMAPTCFVREVESGRDIAHLVDLDRDRLVATVRGLGVRVVVVEHDGGPFQHVDLCGGPLRKALAMCDPAAAATLPGFEDEPTMKAKKSDPPRTCLGFGITEGLCDNPAGTAWSPYWCSCCNEMRMETISGKLKALMVTPSEPWKDDGQPEPDYPEEG